VPRADRRGGARRHGRRHRRLLQHRCHRTAGFTAAGRARRSGRSHRARLLEDVVDDVAGAIAATVPAGAAYGVEAIGFHEDDVARAAHARPDRRGQRELHARATRVPSAATAFCTATPVKRVARVGLHGCETGVATTSRSSTTNVLGSGCDATYGTGSEASMASTPVRASRREVIF
jgi:hypothetical protein